MQDIKTFLIDGAMPGCGRSLAVRGLVDMYQHGADSGYLNLTLQRVPRCKVFLWDACNEPDARTGYKLWKDRATTVVTGRIGTEHGARAYEALIERAEDAARVGPTRVVIDLPHMPHSEFLRAHLKPELLQGINTIPIWLLDQSAASLAVLTDRAQVMPEIYRGRGAVLRNSYFGHWDAFTAWESSGVRMALLEHENWLDLFMLHLSAWPRKKMLEDVINMPLDLANEKALADGSWIGLWRISIQLWRGSFMEGMNLIETL